MPTPSGSDHQGRSLANAAFAASVSVILLALLALAGFFLKSPAIASIIGTSIPMAPTTAACFLILTAALLFKNSGRPRGDLALRAGAAVTLAICAVAALNTPAAGHTMERIPLWRMSPFSGALFLLAAVWFFRRAARGPEPDRCALAAAAALALLSTLVLIGYLYGSPFLYGGHTIPVSFPTGAAFLGLSAALLASDPDSLKLTPFYGDSAEAVLLRSFLPLTAAAVLLNGLLNMGNRTFLDSKPAMNALAALLALTVAAWLARRVSRSVGERLALAQKRQLESEQIFREFMEHSPIYVFFKDENIRSLRLSRNFEKMLGRPIGELLGKNMDELFPSDLAKKVVADDLKTLRESRDISIEEEFNGRRYVTTKFPIKLEGKPPYLAGYTIDITETKLREDMDKARLHLLNFSFSHTLDELLQETLDEAEKLTRSQVSFCHFLEADQRTLSLQNWSTRTKAEFCKAEGKGRHYSVAEAGVWTDCIRERKPVIHNDYASLPHRKGLPPGHAPVKRELVVPVFRSGRIVAILGVGNKASEYDQTDVNTVSIFANLVWDIAERKRAETALLRSERELKDAQHLAHIGNWTLELPSNKLSWSDEIFHIFELDKDRFGASYEAFLDAIHPDDREMVNKAYTDSVKNKSPYDITHRLLMRDGRTKYVNECCETFYDELGCPVRSVGTVQDITERRHLEARLQENERRLKALFANLPGIAYRCRNDRNWTMEFMSNASSPLTGYAPEEFTSAGSVNYADLILPEDRQRVWNQIQEAVKEKKRFQLFYRLRRKDGAVRHFWEQGTGVFSTDGNLLALEGFILDVTEKRDAELRLESLNSKLEDQNREMENFLYITTHDLRSPLVNIQGFSKNLERHIKEMRGQLDSLEVPGPEKAGLENLLHGKIPEALDFVLGSSRKMDGLITALLKVSRIGRVEMKPEKVDMEETLRKVLDAMRFQLEEAQAKVKLAPLPPCTADPGAISQIFTNLLDNAVKYRERSRTLKIEVSGEVRDEVAYYKVRDNGPGIPEKDLSRIWNIFYSHEQNAERSGEGIGLPMVRRIIERNGGSINAESEEGKGTVFHVGLPACRGEK